jgi:hypothetical protein
MGPNAERQAGSGSEAQRKRLRTRMISQGFLRPQHRTATAGKISSEQACVPTRRVRAGASRADRVSVSSHDRAASNEATWNAFSPISMVIHAVVLSGHRSVLQRHSRGAQAGLFHYERHVLPRAPSP